MKALLITSNLEGGGAQKAMLKHAKGLTERKHDVTVLVLERRIEHSLPSGLKLESLLPPGVPLSGGWLGKRMLAWRLRRWFRHATQPAGFDLIISTLPLADEVVRLAGLPRVWFRIANTLSSEIASLTGRKAKRRRERYRKLYDGQNIIAVSQGVADDLRNNLGLARARIETIYNPFDLDDMRALSRQHDPDIPADPYVLHVGRFAKQKRHDVLFDAYKVSGIPDRLVLLAQPHPALSAMIESRGLASRVTVAGFRENPYPWYANAAALVLTSDFEGMPNVLVEALACGTPVVSTDCPSGPREVLTGSMSRFLVPPGDINAIAARLRDVVRSPPDIDPDVIAPFRHDKVLAAIESLGRAS
jgi:glycosyltransferase involved in cell wall biosynthesis